MGQDFHTQCVEGEQERTPLQEKILKECGEWCGVCSTVAKKFLTRGKYKRMMIKKESSREKFDKHAAKKALKRDLRQDSDFKQKFKRAKGECTNLRAGGTSRISHLKESVKEKDSKLVDLVADPGYFWVLRVYTHHIGDPKKSKAKLATRQIGGKKCLGVITKDAPKPLPKGVYRIEVRHRSAVSHAKTHHDGQDVLEEDEVETCAMEVCADVELDVTGASTTAEAVQRICQ